MNLKTRLLQRGFLLSLVFSPAMTVRFPRETQAGPGNALDQRGEDSLESEEVYGANLQAQYEHGFMEILEKLQSYEQFMKKMIEDQLMTRMDTAEKKLNELCAFLPLLQELSQERLERERLEQERLEREKFKSEILVKPPRAKLYTGKNFTGNFEIYDSQSSSPHGKGCHALKTYSGQIKSIDTEGTCVRIYSGGICSYWSQAFYPGMDGNAMDSKLDGVSCIGPCSPNELEDAEIKGSAPHLTVEKRANGVPDIIGDFHTLSSTSLSSSLTSINQYSLGVGNRLEGVMAKIYPKHLRSPEEAEQLLKAGRNFAQGRFNLNEDLEEVGFAIPLELGGVSDQLYNIFPQDKAAGVKYRETFIPLIKQYLQAKPSSSHYYLDLRFLYENSTAIKPRGIWYGSFTDSQIGTNGYLYNN